MVTQWRHSGLSTSAVVSHVWDTDRKSTRLNSSHLVISYAVFCLKKQKNSTPLPPLTPSNVSIVTAREASSRPQPVPRPPCRPRAVQLALRRFLHSIFFFLKWHAPHRFPPFSPPGSSPA